MATLNPDVVSLICDYKGVQTFTVRAEPWNHKNYFSNDDVLSVIFTYSVNKTHGIDYTFLIADKWRYPFYSFRWNNNTKEFVENDEFDALPRITFRTIANNIRLKRKNHFCLPHLLINGLYYVTHEDNNLTMTFMVKSIGGGNIPFPASTITTITVPAHICIEAFEEAHRLVRNHFKKKQIAED